MGFALEVASGARWCSLGRLSPGCAFPFRLDADGSPPAPAATGRAPGSGRTAARWGQWPGSCAPSSRRPGLSSRQGPVGLRSAESQRRRPSRPRRQERGGRSRQTGKSLPESRVGSSLRPLPQRSRRPALFQVLGTRRGPHPRPRGVGGQREWAGGRRGARGAARAGRGTEVGVQARGAHHAWRHSGEPRKAGQPLWSPVPLLLPFARPLSQRTDCACSCSASSGSAADGLPAACA